MTTMANEQIPPTDDDPEIAEIRAIRAAISAECDHDPWKLVARMRAFEGHTKHSVAGDEAAHQEPSPHQG
ncbi:MAG TPA: hypothetical protein VH988_19245 [Thermoanaerobaculia bacterium]|jgi:hypothetical protein|nr:hypothetical protein [Thermoanaerobaculia bacterium]